MAKSPVHENFPYQKPVSGSQLLTPMTQPVDNGESLGGIDVEVDTTGVNVPDSIGLLPANHKTKKGGKK